MRDGTSCASAGRGDETRCATEAIIIDLPWRNQVLTRDGPSISTSIADAEITELVKLAARFEDCRALEIGSAFGYSATALALAGARVLAVDPHVQLNSLDVMVQNLVDYGVEKQVTIWRELSQVALPLLVEQGEKFDLIFIDGDHQEAAVEHDALYAQKLVRPGGVIVCHDYGESSCQGVAPALDRVFGAPTYLVNTLYVVEA